MKVITGISTAAAIVAIASYFGIQPTAEAEQPTFNTGSGSGNYQINNSGTFQINSSESKPAENLDCGQKQLVVTKAGFYGAINPDVYRAMDEAVRRKNTDAILSLLNDGSVIEIPKATPACVVINAFHTYKKQLRFSGSQVTYWVNDNAVRNVD